MKTLNGKSSLNPTNDGEAHLLSGNNVTVRFLMEDIQAKNGIIHVITHIIVPPHVNKVHTYVTVYYVHYMLCKGPFRLRDSTM